MDFVFVWLGLRLGLGVVPIGISSALGCIIRAPDVFSADASEQYGVTHDSWRHSSQPELLDATFKPQKHHKKYDF